MTLQYLILAYFGDKSVNCLSCRMTFEPHHEKRDTNDISIVLRGGQSKLGMSICNVWSCGTKSGITKRKRKIQLLNFLLSVFHNDTNQVASKSHF